MSFWLVTEITALGLMITMTIIGNLGICWVTFNTRNSEPVTAMLMMNMALTDLLKAIVDMPFVFITLVSGDVSSWLLGDIVCELTAFAGQTLCLASTLSVACVSIDRYCTILYTFDYTTVMTTRRAKLMLVMTWCCAVIVSLMPLWGVGLYRFLPASHHCSTDWTYSPIYSSLVLTVGFLLPLSVTSLCNFLIFRAARSQSRRVDIVSSRGGDGTGSGRRRHHRQRQPWRPPRHRGHAAKIILLVFGTFFFCWTTYVVVHIWNIVRFQQESSSGWSEDWTPAADPYDLSRWWVTVVTFVSYVNAVVSPYVYTLLNRRMRKTLRKLLIRLCFPAGRVDYRRSTIVFAASINMKQQIARRRLLQLKVIDHPIQESDFHSSEMVNGGTFSRSNREELLPVVVKPVESTDDFTSRSATSSTMPSLPPNEVCYLLSPARHIGRRHTGMVALVERRESAVSLTSPRPSCDVVDPDQESSNTTVKEHSLTPLPMFRSLSWHVESEQRDSRIFVSSMHSRRRTCRNTRESIKSSGTPLLSPLVIHPKQMLDADVQMIDLSGSEST